MLDIVEENYVVELVEYRSIHGEWWSEMASFGPLVKIQDSVPSFQGASLRQLVANQNP
jgi:hypothetical protein